MKQNKLFTLFSLTLLSIGTPLTSMAQAVTIDQDTTTITAAPIDNTNSAKEIEVKPSISDAQKMAEKDTTPPTTEEPKADTKEIDPVPTETPASFTRNEPASANSETNLPWGTAPWTFDTESGILTINSGELGEYKTSPWRRETDNIDGNQIKKIIFTGPTTAPEYSGSLFANLTNLTEIVNLPNLDTSKATNMDRMFLGCQSLKALDLSNFNTSNVTSTEWMFQDCASLTELNLETFDTSKVTKIWMMFRGCASLTSIDLSKFNTKTLARWACYFMAAQV